MIRTAVESVLRDYPRIYFACHRRHVADEARQRTLSAHQASILDHLDELEGTSLLTLAMHMGVTASTMSLTVERLVRGGYVERQRDPLDGRRVWLRLTADGVRIKRQQKVLDPALVKALLELLPADERRQALHGLGLLARAASELIGSGEFRRLTRRAGG